MAKLFHVDTKKIAFIAVGVFFVFSMLWCVFGFRPDYTFVGLSFILSCIFVFIGNPFFDFSIESKMDFNFSFSLIVFFISQNSLKIERRRFVFSSKQSKAPAIIRLSTALELTLFPSVVNDFIIKSLSEE